MTSPVAAIDLGTNTARLLIARERPEGGIDHLLLRRAITRLGGGFTKEEGISTEAQERSLAALLEFAAHIRSFGVTRVRAVATSAVRDAVNGASFCAAIEAATGIRLEVIDGDTEGRLTLAGVRAGLDCEGDLLVFDVGGGSTEYIVARGEAPLFVASLPLGVVRLTEGKGDLAAMEDKVDRELGALHCILERDLLLPVLHGATLVGTAGTATTLAAIDLGMTDYDYRRVNNHVLTRERIRELFQLLLPLTPEERLRIPGLEKGREDLIVAGTLVALKTMKRFGFTSLRVSDYGLLEGLVRTI